MTTTIKKAFDAVAESRKWRESTSRLLAPMTPEARIEFLNRRIQDFPKIRLQKPQHAGGVSAQ